MVYSGVKGLSDEVPVDKVTSYVGELRSQLKGSKFYESVNTSKKLEPEAEEELKKIIEDCKKTVMAA